MSEFTPLGQPVSRPTHNSLAEPAFWIMPEKPQRQDSLEDQLLDVIALATRYGCWDAVDAIRRVWFDASDRVQEGS